MEEFNDPNCHGVQVEEHAVGQIEQNAAILRFASRMSWERVSIVVTGRDDYDLPQFLNQLL